MGTQTESHTPDVINKGDIVARLRLNKLLCC